MTTTSPAVVIAAATYGTADYLPAAIDSLLAQTYRDFALLLVDDASGDRTVSVATRYAEQEERVRFVPAAEHLGMVENWRRCVLLARELYPGARYFAWASDHDLWESGWLEALVAELDGDPEAVLAYPQAGNIGPKGERYDVEEVRFETRGIAEPHRRVALAAREMRAGNMVYGLHRLDTLVDAGVFRPVLGPDRLLLLELSLRGTFRQVPIELWQRRFRSLFSRERQRRSLFRSHPPLYAYLNPWHTHLAVLLWVYVLRGAGGAAPGRLESMRACRELYRAMRELQRARRQKLRRRWSKRYVKRPWRRTGKWTRRALRRARAKLRSS